MNGIQKPWAVWRWLVSGVVVLTALASGVATGQEALGPAQLVPHAEGTFAPAPSRVRAKPQRRLPPSLLPARVVLDRVDAARLSMEATAQPSKPGVPLKIGLGRDVPILSNASQTSALMVWTSVPSGQIAAISITSPDALGVRLGLLVEKLPTTALLRFYAQGADKVFEVSGQEIMETIARNLAAGDKSDEARTYWSPVIDGQEITVEIELPVGVPPEEAMFSIPRVSHLFSSPLDTRALQEKIGQAASCHLDSQCYTSTWGNESLATAKMAFTSGGSSYVCTGTLMADNDSSTYIPFFLSANHCISTQTEASTLQTYWFYRSTSCNSGSLNPSTQTLTGGATLLYPSSVTDTSFMRLNTAPPSGVFFSGWTASLPALSTSATGIHNPSGDMQKISFATITGYQTCPSTPGSATFYCTSVASGSADHLAVVWSQGITEGGSSGSGLWVASGSSHYLVGQLHGGSSACSTPTSSDKYGRFDVAYNAALYQWLGTGAPTATVPGAPAIGTATAGNAQATVSFTAPTNNGGATITSYTVTSSPGGITKTGTASPITVTGLTNGTSYTFTVKATNSVGTGTSSAASNSVTPSSTIGTTGSLTTTFAGGTYGANGNMFDVQALSGNVTINRFDLSLYITAGTLVPVRVYYKTGSYSGYETTASAWTLLGTYSATSAGQGSPSSMPVGNLLLTSGQTYGIYLTATDGTPFLYMSSANTYSNADLQVTLGAGVYYPFASSLSPRTWNGTIYYSAGGTSATVPGAPTIIAAAAGNGSATLSFTAPASTGGAAISGYKATCGTTTVSGASSPITVAPLNNGTTYACTVKASNSVGDSAPSAAVSVTPLAPATPPGAPTLTSATPNYASATLIFTAPTSTGGATVTSYGATCTASGQSARTGIGSSSPLIVTRLASSVAYSCSVTASNSAGTSGASNSVSVTPIDIASATTVLEMPWFTKVSGYISRFVLMNTGNSAAAYSITILTEDGNTVALNANYTSGSIPVGSQLIVNVDDLVTSFSVGQRAMAIITSNAPVGDLSGIYNLVQPTTGAISNVSLLRGQNFTGTSSVLLAPWFSTASGYSSAFILSNAGNTTATATLSFLAPNGTTVTPLISTLTVPAQGQRIVDTSTLATLSGGTAGAAVFSLNAPEGRIKGTYKIVNSTNGTASSTELVNPQTISGSTTRLVAPWFSTAAGYSSNFILTNRGSSAAAYTITVLTETGNTATTGTLSGTIPANGQAILPASSIVSGFTAATRASAIFDVTGSPAVIDGAYKIISTTGAISTTILARADTSGSSTTTLKLPWFSGAAGYLSRFVLVNRSTSAAPVTIQILPESGNAVTQIATSRTIPARGQLVLPVTDVVSGFTAATRAAAVFTVSAPAADIDGLYNIVNPTSGTISNTMMGK